MKVHELFIHNFRSIRDQKVLLNAYSLLIGANNSGKTNVIDAVRAFYEKELKFEPERDFPKFRTDDEESWIEIEFELSPEEVPTIKAEYLLRGNHFRIRKWFTPPDKAKLGLIGYENAKLSSNMFYGWKNVGQAKLGNLIYIPAASKLEEQTKLTGPSPLRDLINDILKTIIRSSNAFNSFREEFEKFEEAIKREETPDKRSLKGLESKINEEIANWGAKFNLELESPGADDIVKSLVHHSITDTGLNKSMESGSFGHGFQRHLIFTLIRISASYVAPVEAAKKKEFSPELELLLFEEPEAFLHPPQQDVLDTNLRKLALRPGRQVLAATHSPHFVSYNADDLTDLVRLARMENLTQVGQVTKTRLTEIFEENAAMMQFLHANRELPEKDVIDAESRAEIEAIRHFLWLNPERSSSFFADCVLIVEGLSEQVLVNYLLKSGELSCGSKWVFVLDAAGLYNIHRFMHLFGEMKIKHAVVHDFDSEQTGAKKLVQDHLAKLVRDSKNSYTTEVDQIEGNLEKFLGIEIGEEDRWKKPAKILLAVKRKQVEGKKLEALKEKVGKVLAAM